MVVFGSFCSPSARSLVHLCDSPLPNFEPQTSIDHKAAQAGEHDQYRREDDERFPLIPHLDSGFGKANRKKWLLLKPNFFPHPALMAQSRTGIQTLFVNQFVFCLFRSVSIFVTFDNLSTSNKFGSIPSSKKDPCEKSEGFFAESKARTANHKSTELANSEHKKLTICSKGRVKLGGRRVIVTVPAISSSSLSFGSPSST